jgi:hypothetical protein
MNSQDSPRPRLGGSHHLPPYIILCAWPWDLHPNGILSWDSQMRISYFPKLGLPQFWRPIILCADLWLKWGLKQSCIPCQELSNSMWHATCTQGNQGDSQLLVVGSQIANLTPNLSFGHNLCFKYPNGPCEPILDIFVPKDFQWHKEFFNPMSFGPCNPFLKIRETIRTPTPNVGVHLGMCGFIPSHFPALPGTWMWLLGFILGSHPS